MAQFDRSRINNLTYKIIASAIEVHRQLGPGLLEAAYQRCMALEFATRGFAFETELPQPVVYKGMQVECGFRLDFKIEDLVIVELKAVQDLAPVHHAQLLTYLKLTGAPVGLLINFNVTSLRQGIHRLLNSAHEIVDNSNELARKSR